MILVRAFGGQVASPIFWKILPAASTLWARVCRKLGNRLINNCQGAIPNGSNLRRLQVTAFSKRRFQIVFQGHLPGNSCLAVKIAGRIWQLPRWHLGAPQDAPVEAVADERRNGCGDLSKEGFCSMLLRDLLVVAQRNDGIFVGSPSPNKKWGRSFGPTTSAIFHKMGFFMK